MPFDKESMEKIRKKMSDDLIILSPRCFRVKMRMVFRSNGEFEKNNVEGINHFVLCTCSYNNSLLLRQEKVCVFIYELLMRSFASKLSLNCSEKYFNFMRQLLSCFQRHYS